MKKKVKTNQIPNKFIENIYTEDTFTENLALSHSTTGDIHLDYFSKCGTYRLRSLDEVFSDMGRMWSISPLLTLKIIFYLRLISRQAKGFINTEKVQKGQGNRDEFRKAILWLIKYQGEIFYKNIWLIPVIGTWKDLWHWEIIDEIDHQEVYSLIKCGLEDDYNKELIAKYLPRLRSKSNCKIEKHLKIKNFVLGLCKFLNWTPVEYRKFKSSGKAHQFQRDMCENNWKNLNFNAVPGRALFKLLNDKGRVDDITTIERHDLIEKYLIWVRKQPILKFTGYVYELMKAVNPGMSLAQKYTVDKQFDQLIELAKKDTGDLRENVWCALDTSGSMCDNVADTTAFDICVSMGIYFSTLNKGAFKDHVVMFSNNSEVRKLHGSFADKVFQIKSSETAWGSTNFQSVIDEIVRIRIHNPEIPVSDYPSTLLVISDMQFNPVGGNTKTNYEEAMMKLQQVGLPKIRIIWWYVTGRGKDFPSKIDDRGVILMSGFDGAVLTSILNYENKIEAKKNKPDKFTPFDNMLKVLDQETLNKITL